MIKKMLLSAFLSLFIIAMFCRIASAEPPVDITVSAAISLKNAFEEIGKIYESQNKGIKVMFNFGASGDLMMQIKGGAPVDVFASAALKDMDELDNAGFVLKDTRVNFATNSLVLITPMSSKIALVSFDDLKKAEVKKIAVGNPKTVPVGRYTEETFQYFKVSDMIKEKLVFAENVRQVLDYVARGEVDAGVVYSTDAMVKQQEVRIVVTTPEASHKPVVYPIAVVKSTKNEKAAKAFLSLVTSEEGRKILSKYGFKTAGQSK
ncbi:MAG TPA: molybdate ABC transporter substrate-binding protein [Nitrospirota bacterium]|nr:molybdate ABC transporter substrate-binding protein [Nitrospirota bacterium]